MPDVTLDQTATTPGDRLASLAGERPDELALIDVRADGTHVTLTWRELERRTNQVARLLEQRGASAGSFVAIGLPNRIEHVLATWATWKLGGCPMPISSRLPARERDAMLRLGSPAVVVAQWPDLEAVRLDDLAATQDLEDSPLPAAPAPHPAKALGSGGSTGSPKLIVTPGPFAFEQGANPVEAFGVRTGGVAYLPGPLYHNQPFLIANLALFAGSVTVINERFDASECLATIERLGVTFLSCVPTHMARMLRAPDVADHDLSSLEVVLHMAAPCPAWVKRGWIDLIGPQQVVELWGTTENVGTAVIRGDEWLEHPGSVGRPVDTIIKILDDDGNELPAGEVGEIFSRPEAAHHGAETFEYLGASPLRQANDGLVTVGDLGWLDDDGYLYLADRRQDLIITGGANVFPAEVEAALSSHPGVVDVAVVGIPDESGDLGRLVHAIIEPGDIGHPPSVDELRTHAAEQIAGYKLPRSWEFVGSLPRADSGKIRRSALADERTTT